MRDFILLFAVGLIVVVGIGWFLLPERGRELFTGSDIEVQPAGPEKPAEEAAAPVRPRRVRPQPVVEQDVSAVRASGNVAADQVVPILDQTTLNFPAPGEVTTGEERDDIIDEYGVPQLSAFTQDRGHLFETYVYRRERSEAVINLQDGRVSGVFLRDSAQLRHP
ncbi:MAG: hypothetical protein LAP38_07955 [Acidobacteriia bacterium]|nr:hypothetical protein [Terriglobia bacterium]